MEIGNAHCADNGLGTSWGIWDLHVHTPASAVQDYGGNTDEVWDRFLNELENLHEDIRVIGINDYWFLDGYKRILEERSKGRLRNLDEIFPVIELRFEHFGGTDGKLSRINAHVVFDPEIKPETIEAQFINALQPKVKLAPDKDDLGWQGVITRESLEELGEKIKKSVPKEQGKHYGTDFQEGFNNLNVSLKDVKDVLSRPYFKGKTLLGLGKTEWADIKWNDNSIAAKKNVINSADFIFTAFQDASRWKRDVEALRESNVKSRLLDCSDAHDFMDSSEHTKLGACQTWMNTTPTFAGLAYALEEFERRVFVGLEPPSLSRERRNPESFISRVTVRSESDDHKTFDYSLPINPGFVAVVGNKGQGKSALLDCIALAGNSSRQDEFAFLNKQRFLSSAGQKQARHYYSEVRWASGKSRRVDLVEQYDKGTPVSIEYLPQAYVERVCNADPTSDDSQEFESELRDILFTHIGEEDRLGTKSFDELLSLKTETIDSAIRSLQENLARAVQKYTALASFRASNRLEQIDSKIELKNSEIANAEEALAKAENLLSEFDAASHDDGEHVKLRKEAAVIEEELKERRKEKAENEKILANLNRALATMETVLKQAQTLEDSAAQINAVAESYLDDSKVPLISVKIDTNRFEEWKSNTVSNTESIKSTLNGLDAALDDLEQLEQTNKESLASADSARERARQRVLQVKERIKGLKGNEDSDESLDGLLALRSQIEEAPAEMAEASGNIIKCSRRIYDELSKKLGVVKELYSPATDFIETSEVVRKAGLEFGAGLRIVPVWENLSGRLDARRNPDFSGWMAELPQRVVDTSWATLKGELVQILNRLETERGECSGKFRDPESALRTKQSLPDFLNEIFGLSWLNVRFGLTGEGQPLAQLSPGQRGLILSLFYLVVDRRTTPLLLDQPEENLDNETIASKLVPAIHEAAGRRQTIVVTHNANLAVVGDADQVIHCLYSDGQFSIESGSISELDVTRFALNVLEGTKTAFDNRRQKYEAFPEITV